MIRIGHDSYHPERIATALRANESKKVSSGPESKRGKILGMELGKLLVILGLSLVVAGVALMLLGRMNLPLGRLPGDFTFRGKNTTVYFPLATSLVVSVLLSILLYVVSRWRR
jgi:hypothetical protein